MAGKGIKGASKGRKKLKNPNQVQGKKSDGLTGHIIGETEVRNSENNEELAPGGSSSGNHGKSEKIYLVDKDVYELLESLKIKSSDRPEQVPPTPRLSAEQCRVLKLIMEADKINKPVHTSECGHPNPRRDIDDCGTNLCWAIAAIRCVSWNLDYKGGSNEMKVVNYERLLECYKEDNNGYPYILKKAFKYVKDHNISMEAYYPKVRLSDETPDQISEEVEALRLTGFQLIDHTDELALVKTVLDMQIIGGVRESPEFTFVRNGVYRGSDYEVVVDGKYCNHALEIYGIGSKNDGTNFWVVQNPYHPEWGVKGQGRIARDSSLPNHRKHLLKDTMFPTFE